MKGAKEKVIAFEREGAGVLQTSTSYAVADMLGRAG